MRKTSIALSLLACSALAACGAYSLSATERSTAELGARDFAERTNAKFASCSGQDSDGDSYVTCTIVSVETGQDQDLLCSYAENARGCKRKGV